MRETVLDLGSTSWFKIGYEKIWVHLFWKIFTDGKYIVEFKNANPGDVFDQKSVAKTILTLAKFFLKLFNVSNETK